MNRLESIKENMASCTDGYVDTCEFLVDMEYLIQRLEIAQKALEKIEWINVSVSGLTALECPSCGHSKEDGHNESCVVKKALDQLKE